MVFTISQFICSAEKRPSTSQQFATHPPKRMCLNAVRGPLGLFWIKMKNVIESSHFGVKDKFSNLGLNQIVGSYNRDEHLYLGFEQKDACERAMMQIGQEDPSLEKTFVSELPEYSMSQLPQLMSNHRFDDEDHVMRLGNLSSSQSWKSKFFVKRLLTSNGFECSTFNQDKFILQNG